MTGRLATHPSNTTVEIDSIQTGNLALTLTLTPTLLTIHADRKSSVRDTTRAGHVTGVKRQSCSIAPSLVRSSHRSRSFIAI